MVAAASIQHTYRTDLNYRRLSGRAFLEQLITLNHDIGLTQITQTCSASTLQPPVILGRAAYSRQKSDISGC
jgi:hypothetical protein